MPWKTNGEKREQGACFTGMEGQRREQQRAAASSCQLACAAVLAMGERGTVGLLGGEKKSSEQKSSVACGGKKIRVAGVLCCAAAAALWTFVHDRERVSQRELPTERE